jgi:DNA-binding NarL/FixJ family response regulator
VINLYAAKEADRPRIVHESRNAILPRYERTQNTNLSKREKQVEELILRGMQRKPMAIALQISEYTLKLHISRILRKREIRNRNMELSKREKEVEELILTGMRRKQMALVLQISEHTVKLHISKILKKRKARSMVELAIRDALRKSSLSE